jgi:Uma2 family endonuclease
MMAPANIDHDQFFAWLRTVVSLFVEARNLGNVFGPEVLVRLPRQRRLRMPDLAFVSRARSDIVQSMRIVGAPDLIMEVVSPESVSRDWRDKYVEYERAGVTEYWVIDRAGDRMEAYTLGRGGKYRRIDEHDGRVRSSVLRDFFLTTPWALGAARPKVGEVLRQFGIRL